MSQPSSPSPLPPLVAPSILASDYARFGEEAEDIVRQGADWLHLDVMDGHFVDNISFGPGVVKALRPRVDVFFDVHLMITRPDRYWERFADAGASGITVHVEAEHDVAKTLRGIRERGLKTGLALNPDTSLEAAKPYLEQIDLLLCMTVVPGFGGQAFMREVLPKIEEAASARRQRGLAYHIEVDGGIDPDTAAEAAGAGANVFVAGTTIFKADNRRAMIANLREAAGK